MSEKEKVSEFTGRKKKVPTNAEAEFFNDLDKVMRKHDGSMTMATMVGVLEVIKTDVMMRSMAQAQEAH